MIGCVPSHEPELADNVCPCCADPETTGADTTDGATTVGAGLGAAATTADAAEAADADPFLFDAVTITRTVAPTSAEPNTYD